MKLPHERFEYSPIASRRPWKLPKGARIAVWTIVNVEEWSIEKGMPRQYLTSPQGVAVMPDVPNWAWHEYGMRVGFWRLHEALTRRKIPVTTAINAHVCVAYPAVAQAMLDARWEFMGHGVVQGAMHLIPDQRAAIGEAIRIIEKFTGKKPKGWLGPGLTETWETLDLLREAGIEYISDWVNDDQPYQIRTTSGPLVSVPYSIELNDIPTMVIQHHESSQWLDRCRKASGSGRCGGRSSSGPIWSERLPATVAPSTRSPRSTPRSSPTGSCSMSHRVSQSTSRSKLCIWPRRAGHRTPGA